MRAGTPASFAALATRMLPSTFIIHCLFRSREGWMIQASNTTASAPRKCGTRSSFTTSASAHSTLGTANPGLREPGHAVRAGDGPPRVFGRPEEGEPDYVQAALSDAGDAFAVVRGTEAV